MTGENLEWLSLDLNEDLWWIFYFKTPQTVMALQPLLNELAKIDLHIIGQYISDPYFRIILREEEGNMHLQLSNPSDDIFPYLVFGTSAEQFLQPGSPEARLCADRFLEYGKICYRMMRPLYAFAENLNIYIEMDDVKAHRLTHVCWAQFFGPEFVQGFGQEVLMNAPAWRNENLGDGGLLYVLAASPYLYRGPRQYWDQARKYFAQYVATPIVWSDLPQ